MSVFASSVATLNLPYLLIHSPEGLDRVNLSLGSYWTIGRSRDSSIVLKDQATSRKHAMVQVMNSGQFYLIDLGSRNGSFIHGRRVSIPVVLQNGDRITLGQTQIEFFNPREVAALADEDREDPSSTTLIRSNRCLITVMVMDIRDFTGLTRKLGEELLSEVMGTWFRQAGEIIRQHDSWVDKYIGDAVMAVWIHNVTDRDPMTPQEMLKVLRALQDLHAMSSALNQQFPLPQEIRVGVGVNTGPAMVGQMGSGSNPEYTALGDTVNAAFRLESATKEIGVDIALGETTHQYLGDLMLDSPFKQHIVNLKGYEAPVPAYGATFKELAALLNQC
jgi:adenylate cyclase